MHSPQEKPVPTPPPSSAQLPLVPIPPPGPPEQPPEVKEVFPPPDPEAPVPTTWEEPTTVQESMWEEPLAPVAQTQQEPTPEPGLEPDVEEPQKPPSPKPTPPEAQEPVRSALPAQVQNQNQGVERSSTPTSGVKRPSSSVAHRHSTRFKIGDKAVVMPNYTPSTEKFGMQFGSLSLGGDDIDRCAPHDPFIERV